MRLSKERKIYAVLVGVAAVGLGAVFFGSGSGASVTEASAAVVEEDAKPATKPAIAEAESSNGLLSLASKLKSFETSHKMSGSADAFKPGSSWVTAKPKAEIAVAAQAVDAFKGSHQLSAVLVAGQKSRAIVDGRTFGIGQALDGYKLVAVTPKTAVFESGGMKAVLRVPVPDQIAAVDVR